KSFLREPPAASRRRQLFPVVLHHVHYGIRRMKNCLGVPAVTVLVMLKLLPPNVPLLIEVQLVSGTATFVLASTSNCSPTWPLVPLITRLVPPERLTLVIYGCGTVPPVTPAVTVPAVVRLLVQVRPGADGKTTDVKAPVIFADSSNWNVCPFVIVPPRFVTMI